MTTKEYLSQAKQQDRRIGALLERQRRYHEIGAWRTGGSARMRALEKELDARIDAYALLVLEIEGVIDGVADPQYRDVLRYRYLNGWNWQRIAERMSFSQDWVWRLHKRALEVLEAQGVGQA